MNSQALGAEANLQCTFHVQIFQWKAWTIFLYMLFAPTTAKNPHHIPRQCSSYMPKPLDSISDTTALLLIQDNSYASQQAQKFIHHLCSFSNVEA